MSQMMTEEPALSVGMEGDVPMPPEEEGPGLKERAEHAAQTAAQKSRDMAGYVSHKAQDATSTVGSGLKSLGEAVREKAPAGPAVNAVADTLEHTGRYLQEEGISGAAHDLTGLIRRNPIPALLIGIGFGFLIAQATSKRS